MTAALVAALVGGGIAVQVTATSGETPAADSPADEAVEPRADLTRLPLTFVANAERWDPRASWVVSGREATAYFVDGGIRWALAGSDDDPRGWALDQALVGARGGRPRPSATNGGRVSYFVGHRHDAGLPTATELTLTQAWPGVDVVWSGAGGNIEATYRLAAGADPSRVAVAWRGADALTITDEGRLAVATPVRSFEEDAPKAYQEIGGQRVPVQVGFELKGADTYGFRLGAYDPTLPVIIDPTVLLYASFLGGDGSDQGEDIAVDGQGNAYVTGRTNSTALTFPETVGAFQPQYGGGSDDAFVAKVNPSGTALVYASFLGGSEIDAGMGIEVDGSGNAYVGGYTWSTAATFPETSGAFQTENAGRSDAFAAKIDPTGSSLLYSTFFGGADTEVAFDLALDPTGNVYLGGNTSSTATTFPETPGAFQPQKSGGTDAFVAKLNATGSAVVYASFLGGGGSLERANAIAVDPAGNAYLAGITDSTGGDFPVTPGVFQPTHRGGGGDFPRDAFVAKVNPTGTALIYASFLGGGGTEEAFGIDADAQGHAYVVGSTSSAPSTFPETPGVFQPQRSGNAKRDAFVAKVNPTGTALDYNTYLGGAEYEAAFDVKVDAAGNAYVAGQTTSPAATFPDTPGWFQPENGGSIDAFVAKINPTATALLEAGFFGGAGAEDAWGIDLDATGNIYITGNTSSSAATFPETPGAFQPEHGNAGNPVLLRDAFVAKIAQGEVGPTTTSTTSTSTTTTTTATSNNYCGRSLATIVGTPGNDAITGTPDRDVIKGLGGDDTITGLGGDDVICGDDGADTISCDSGHDVLAGNAGNDTIIGGGFNDFVTGGPGDDVIRGGDNDDQLLGDDGNDEMGGGDGADVLRGGNDRDALDGGAGNDQLEGNAGDDRVIGGEGSDSLVGNEDNDRLDARDAGGLTDTLSGGPESDLCFSDPTDVPPSLDQRDC